MRVVVDDLGHPETAQVLRREHAARREANNRLAEQARHQNRSREEYLAALLTHQVADREAAGNTMRIRTAYSVLFDTAGNGIARLGAAHHTGALEAGDSYRTRARRELLAKDRDQH